MKRRQFDIHLNTAMSRIVVDGQELTGIRSLKIKAAAGDMTTITLEEYPASIRVHGLAAVHRQEIPLDWHQGIGAYQEWAARQ